MKYDRHKKLKVAQNTFAIVFWAAIVILCLIYKDQITVDNIVAYAPDNMFVAAVVMLMLFAVKSVLVFVYCGLLYAASGILFPVPIAILVNILGSLIMAAIPFWIGKRAGVKLVDGLLQNQPKFKFLKDTPNKIAVLHVFLCADHRHSAQRYDRPVFWRNRCPIQKLYHRCNYGNASANGYILSDGDEHQ